MTENRLVANIISKTLNQGRAGKVLFEYPPNRRQKYPKKRFLFCQLERKRLCELLCVYLYMSGWTRAFVDVGGWVGGSFIVILGNGG